MFHSVKSYVRFLLNSKNKHGVHSPFVFDFLTLGLEADLPGEHLKTLENFRKDLLENDTVIRVRDFGAGSRVFKGPERPVCKIAKTAGISEKRAKLLFKTVRHFQPNRILELGTSLGLATTAMSLGAPRSNIDTLEGCPETAKVAKTGFVKHGLKNIELHVGEFEELLPDLLEKNRYDLIFFDGNHQREATLNYFELCLQNATENSLFIFDDIHWSRDMETAWDQIKTHPEVTLTIDTYHWGLVFFRNDREKEHFTLRV